jgi:hypothetical protein
VSDDGPRSGEGVLAYQSPEGASVVAVRSILLSSSLHMLRERGHFERYLEVVSPVYRDQIVLTLAPTWLPIRAAEAHYRAWEALGLADSEIEALASGVSGKLTDTFLATVVRSSRGVGATPWLLLNHAARAWSRVFQGGSVTLTTRGPKEVLLEARGLTMFDGHAFPLAYRRVITSALGLFARRVYGRYLAQKEPHSSALLLSWV